MRLEEPDAGAAGDVATLTPRRRRPGRPAVALDRTEHGPAAFEVEPVVLRAGWGPVAVVSLLHRRRDLDLASFSAHWRGPHSVFALGLAGATGYVQLHARRDGAALDGIAVTLFEEEERARAEMASARIAVDARADEGRFLDAARCASFLCDAILSVTSVGGGS